MIRWLRRYRNFFWIATTVAMLLSIVGAGGFYFVSKDLSDAVAIVGGVKIPYLYYRRLVDRATEEMRREHRDVTDELSNEIKQEVVQSLIVTQIDAIKAQELGIQVSDEELAWAIHQDPQFQTDGVFNQPLYIQTVLQGYNTTVEDFEAQLRKELTASKYQQLLATTIKLLPGEMQEEYKRSHKGSMKGYDKDQQKFASSLHRMRMLSTLQAAARQAAVELNARQLLQEREQGAG